MESDPDMPHPHSPSARRRHVRRAAAAAGTTAAALVAGLAVGAPGATAAPGDARPGQPELTTRHAALITEDGYEFRDLDGSGDLTPYEDWRLSPAKRAQDLLSRLSLEEKAGLLVHGTLATTDTGYDAAANATLIGDRHMTTMITRLSAEPGVMAEQSNAMQELAEQERFGIPLVISSDPRNGFSVTAGQTVKRLGTTAFPDAIGMAAARRLGLTRNYGHIIRQEYRAVGLSEGLSPQADIATEPRWTRINGTFGSAPQRAKRQVHAYIKGIQAGSRGLHSTSVAAVVKHWVGYGAQDHGYDSHYYYGRYATFEGGQFARHLVPFTGAFSADTAGVMPTYSILKDLTYQGHAVEQKGAGFNDFLLKDLLRGQYGFDGVIVSDFGITGDCPQECQDNRPPAFFIGPWGVGMPWGMEDSTTQGRFVEAITAGVDQIGGSNEPSYVTAAVQAGDLTTARVNASARRVLVQKFELGLFETPYVDPAAAERISGNARFQAIGDRAQAASLTLLTNKRSDGRHSRQVLPASESRVKTVFLVGVDPAEAEARGLSVTDDPAAADLAVVRMDDPRGGADLTDLNFTGDEPAYVALQAAVDAGTPVVAVPKLDRPLVLTNVADRADAVLANYGVSDEVLLETIFGERSPGGRLPFELPASMAQVDKQLGDVPDDIRRPLFDIGDGLHYRG